MSRNMLRNTTLALGALVMSSTLVFAAGTPGSVTALDGKGMATIRTTDGKDHQVKVGDGFKVGSKVECASKNNVMECRMADAQAAMPATPSTATPAPAKVAPAPAPAAAAPTAAPSSTTSAPSQAAPAPSTTAPAPAAK